MLSRRKYGVHLRKAIKRRKASVRECQLNTHINEILPVTQSPVLSICFAIKNRSRLRFAGRYLELFPNCIRALTMAAESLGMEDKIELVISDFHSDDWPLSKWLKSTAGKLSTRVLSIDASFSKGRGLNAAIHATSAPRLFICDADILIGPDAVSRAIEICDTGGAWVPVCRCLDQTGRFESWRQYGHGLVAAHRDIIDRAGPFPEFESWGGEDILFFKSLSSGTTIIREMCGDLNHQWHPEASRHEHYLNEKNVDYHAFLDGTAERSADLGTPLRRFYAQHARWQGEIHFFKDRRMARPGYDTGWYKITSEKLELVWERWSPAVLFWHEETSRYVDANGTFFLSEIIDDGEFGSD